MSEGSKLDPTLIDDGVQPVPSDAVAGAPMADDAVLLTLEDLVADEAGEVVLEADNVAISLKTDGHVVDGGVAADHVTSAGVDVSGLLFATLDTGITIYYSGHVELIV